MCKVLEIEPSLPSERLKIYRCMIDNHLRVPPELLSEAEMDSKGEALDRYFDPGDKYFTPREE